MKDSKFLTFLISLVAAICLWIFVVTVVNPDGSVTISDIPVTFSGEEVLREDQNLIIADGKDTTLSVQFTGKNSEMQKLKQAKDEIVAVVDVTRIRSAKEYTLGYELSLPSSVQESAVTIQSRSPSAVTFTAQRYVTREIEVKGDFSGLKVRDGYVLDSVSFDYDTITVKGPEPDVSQIASALVIVKRDDVSRSFTEQIEHTFVDADGEPVDVQNLKWDVKMLELTVNVSLSKEVPLNVEFINGGGAVKEDVSYEITPEKITLSGDASVMESLNKIDLGNIDLAVTPNSKEYVMQIVIPDGVKNVSGVEQATVSVRIKNRETASVRATNITFINKPENLEVTSMTQLVQATVRASAEDVENITSSNLRVVADLQEYTQPGKYTVPVEIIVDGFDDAGVVGEYSIVVSITEKE